MPDARIVIGKLEHPLLRNLIDKLGCENNIIAIDWSNSAQNLASVSEYRHFPLHYLFKRVFFSFWVVFFLARKGKLVLDIHFVRKEILVFLLMRRLFGIQRKSRLDLIFWGTDARSLGVFLYFFRVLIRRSDSVSCTSIAMEGYLKSFFKREIKVRYFPSPNEGVLKRVPYRERNTVRRLVIGNNGRQVQRHFEILSAFRGISLRKQIEYVLFPITYMVEVDQNELLNEAKIIFPNAEIRILLDRLTEKDFFEIFNCDVYVNFQKTDAFSTFLLECLGAGLTCIVDNQIRYKELQNIHHLIYFGDHPSFSVLQDDFVAAEKGDVNVIRRDFLYSESLMGRWG